VIASTFIYGQENDTSLISFPQKYLRSMVYEIELFDRHRQLSRFDSIRIHTLEQIIYENQGIMKIQKTICESEKELISEELKIIKSEFNEEKRKHRLTKGVVIVLALILII